jgi:hypothetical protein
MNHSKLSWNTHYLLTRIAVRPLAADLNGLTKVTSLEQFIALAGEDLQDVIAANLHLPGGQNDHGKKVTIVTPHDLLIALRLNPKATIPYVRAIEPEEMSVPVDHDMSRSGPPAPSYKQTAEQEQMKISEVFATFSDEPDWGMDQELFSVEGYPYGRAPFGIETGLSSQAAFHMAFYHENRVLTSIFPDLKITFVKQRARLFLELARLAMRKGAPYWGWRFAAWAAHYPQDLTQPYHARALPFPLARILWGVVRRLVSWGSAPPSKNFLVNRHHIFEAVAHYMINEAAKNRLEFACVPALEKGGVYAGCRLDQVMRDCSKVAANLAVEMNRTFERVIDDPRIDDPEYSVLEQDYPLEEKIAEALRERPEIFDRLTMLIGVCMEQTGKVTRYVIHSLIH